MQAISPVTTNQLLASGQEMRVKFEIYVGAAWINLCDLGGKDYVEDWSASLGGATMTPAPVGGTLGITLSNEDGVFNPTHPTSAYKDYIVTGRKCRLSIGGKYGGTDYYWQRIIGHIDEPRFENFKVHISGGDYMKFLEDTELRSPNNYWGSSQVYDSIASDGIVGSELYNEADAMDINNEANNVTNWSCYCGTFASYGDVGGGSTYVGRAIVTAEEDPYIFSGSIFTPTADTEYRFQFKYKHVTGTGLGHMRVIIYQGSTELGRKEDLNDTSYTQEEIWFTALTTDDIWIQIEWYDFEVDVEYRIDQFSFFKFVPYEERYYELPADCKGVYRVILDGEDVWQGEKDHGWYYTPDEELGPDPPAHPARILWFDENKEVANGSSNLTIYYFTTQPLEEVLADLLVTAGLYVNQAAALADMDYTDPAIDIDQVWFDAGTPVLKAIKIICERCDYRFFFNYGGKPDFNPKPSPGATAFTFTDQKHVASISRYEDRNEIWNRIVIEGKELAEPINREEALPAKLTGEASDATSISNYGERTMTINNHLFQSQASIDAMVASLLAEYKDPKWYCNVPVPFNPAPLEMGDKISFKERLSSVLEATVDGLIRDNKISKFDITYKCEVL